MRSLHIAGIALAALTASTVWGFDAGHHEDITEEVCHFHLGLSVPACRTMRYANYLVDYFNYYDIPSGLEFKPTNNRLHFDTLYSAEQVVHAWKAFSRNAQAIMQDFASTSGAATDPRVVSRTVAFLGAALHPIQDFYTHSDWAETHPKSTCQCLPMSTIMAYSEADLLAYEDKLFTGQSGVAAHIGTVPSTPANPFAVGRKHGNNCAGVNHDNYNRPNWRDAYSYAYAATFEFLSFAKAVISSANPALWEAVQKYEPGITEAGRLNHELEVVGQLAQYVTLSTDVDGSSTGGFWKGSGSGDRTSTATMYTYFQGLTKSIAYDSHVINEGTVLVKLSEDVYDFSQVALDKVKREVIWPPMTPLTPSTFKGIMVRTTEASTSVSTSSFFGSSRKPDLYAVIGIAGKSFIEGIVQDDNSINPQWTSIRFVPSTTSSAQITYSLFDDVNVQTSPLLPLRDTQLKVTRSDTTNSALVVNYDMVNNVLTATSRADIRRNSFVSSSGQQANVRFEVVNYPICTLAQIQKSTTPDMNENTKDVCVEKASLSFCTETAGYVANDSPIDQVSAASGLPTGLALTLALFTIFALIFLQ